MTNHKNELKNPEVKLIRFNPSPPPPDAVSIVMDLATAQALNTLLYKGVGGEGEGRNRLTTSLGGALRDAGVGFDNTLVISGIARVKDLIRHE